MSLISSLRKPIDTPNRLEYLTALKQALETDAEKYHRILSIIHGWLGRNGCTSGIAADIQEISRILKGQPMLVRDVNAVLPDDFVVDCCTDVENVEYVVLIMATAGQILATSSGLAVPEPSSTRDIRVVLPTEEDWKGVVKSVSSDHQLASCLSQLLQREVDDPRLDPAYKQIVFRRLVNLSKSASTLPPSLYLRNVSREGKYPEVNGGYADIYRGKIKDQMVCIKSLRLFSAHGAETKLKDFLREVLVWKRLSHINVLPFLGANKTLCPSLGLISPWMKHGNLATFLKENPDHDKLTATAEIVRGLIYLHGHRPPIFHRDIKAVNVLVDDDLHCCIGDFGLSSIAGSQRIESKSLARGTIRWQAPELLAVSDSEGILQENAGAADVYALGCTISEIYTGKIPFHEHKLDGPVILAVMGGKKPALPPLEVGATDGLQSLVSSCWEFKPEHRPTMARIGDILISMGVAAEDLSVQDNRAAIPDLGSLADATAWIDNELAMQRTSASNEANHALESTSHEIVKRLSTTPNLKDTGIRKKIELPPLITPTINATGGMLTPISPDAFSINGAQRDESGKSQGISSIPLRKPFARQSSPLAPFVADSLPSPPGTPTPNARGPSMFYPAALVRGKSLGASGTQLSAGAPAFLPSPKIRAKTHRLSVNAPAFLPPPLRGALAVSEIPTMESPPASPLHPSKVLNPAAVPFTPLTAVQQRLDISGGQSSTNTPVATPPLRENRHWLDSDGGRASMKSPVMMTLPEAGDVDVFPQTLLGSVLEDERPVITAGFISPPATPLRLNPNAPVFSLGRLTQA